MGTAHDDGEAAEGRRDADLAVAAASGDPEALAAIYDRYAPRVLGLAVRQLGDRDAAADVTQDVFLTAAQRIGGLTDPDRLRAWLFAVARHRIVDHVRRSRRVVPTDTIEDVDMTAGTSGDGGEGFDRVRGSELRALLADSSAGLDDRDRLVLELAYGAELAGQDLADALGVKENTAHQLLSRARGRMRTSLGALLVARQGRRDCEDLATLLEPWDGTFSTVWRKRVARHVDGCDICSETERRVLSPAALGTAFPAVLVPEGLREQLLTALELVPAPLAAATPGRPAPASAADRPWRDDGFPPEDDGDLEVLAAPTMPVRPRRGPATVLPIVAVVIVGLAGAWWGASALAGNASTPDNEVIAGAVGDGDEAVATVTPSPSATSVGTGTTPAPTTAAPAATSTTTGPLIAPEPPTTDDPPDTTSRPPTDPLPVLVVNPAGPLRLSRSGIVELTVSHTGESPAAVTVSVPDGYTADPDLLDLGAGGFVGVTVRWLVTPNDPPPPPGTITVAAAGFQGTSVEVRPFRDLTPGPSTPPPTTATITPPVTLVLPPLDPPVLLPPGPD